MCLPLDTPVMQAIPQQRGPAATARAGLQPGHLPALRRAARGDGRLVADQPSAQDGGPRRASRPRHHLPAGRGGGHRPHDQGHPNCDPPPSSASVMCVTAILT